MIYKNRKLKDLETNFPPTLQIEEPTHRFLSPNKTAKSRIERERERGDSELRETLPVECRKARVNIYILFVCNEYLRKGY